MIHLRTLFRLFTLFPLNLVVDFAILPLVSRTAAASQVQHCLAMDLFH